MNISYDVRIDPAAEAQVAPPPVANDEPKLAEQPRAWIVVCKGLGLINIIAKSAAELVKRLHTERLASAASEPPHLVAFDVLDNTEDYEQAVIWFDPGLVQAVINEYKRPVAGPMQATPFRTQRPAGAPELNEVAVVVVKGEEPGDGEE